MINTKLPEELEAELGRQLRDLRLRQNINQQQLAVQAGVALNAVKNLEAGKGATIGSLVKVLRALGHASWLSTLAPPFSVGPLQIVKDKPVRLRASKKKGTKDV